MRESAIERYLVQQVAKAGGKAYKWVSPGNRGVPDRICIFHTLGYTDVIFVELKRPGGALSKQQIAQCANLIRLGCSVVVIDSKEQVDRLVKGVWPVRRTNEI